MTKRIFRAIMAVALIVLMGALLLSLGVLYPNFTQIQFNQLHEETLLAAQALAQDGLSYLEGLDDNLSCRMTWIDESGTILYDSRSDHETMENHLQREEIRQAMQSGYGQSARYSGTLLQRYLYAAQRLPDGTILRLSIQQSTVFSVLVRVLQFIAVVMIAAVVLSFALARRLSLDIVKPLNELNLDDPMSNQKYEEIFPLLRRLESQQGQLRAQAIELRQKQKEFLTVTRSLSEGLVLMNSAGTILSINPAAARILEVTQNCLGADFSVANRNAGVAALVDGALSGEKEESTISLAGGNYMVAASPVKTEDAVFGVVLLFFDVTEKQKAEQLRREFTANVSHELKTPLHAISGYAELMKSGMVPLDDMLAFSGKIYTETQRLARLVEDTLRLSRLDEGAADMQWAETDLYSFAQSTVQELEGAAELDGVTLRLEGGSAKIQSIPQLLSAVLFNLTDNAIKYNHPGGSVTVVVRDQPHEALLVVRDTGIGIPKEDQDRIFERFYRVDKSHSKEVGGTGLGLSIVKHAALILGAQIDLTSTLGKGTTITLRFPKEI